MRSEPIEFSVMNDSRRARQAARLTQSVRDQAAGSLPAAAAMDAAFADFSRIDVGTPRVETSGERRKVTKEIVANIAAQLGTLDRQREQLAELLRSVELNAPAN